ncbi:hypothetical protein LR48_Vigan02g052200 [Vigna angularis]|uniref:Uncharacterized protein n=1 Tax=Phaseolus angularis TaxID=3914 RepID=A0A0L9TVC9_PHAAN|nr:hypothetical protein LR48_Vigan02g052200 [Vigna angularis]
MPPTRPCTTMIYHCKFVFLASDHPKHHRRPPSSFARITLPPNLRTTIFFVHHQKFPDLQKHLAKNLVHHPPHAMPPSIIQPPVDFAGDNGGAGGRRTVATQPLTQREKRDKRSDEGGASTRRRGEHAMAERQGRQHQRQQRWQQGGTSGEEESMGQTGLVRWHVVLCFGSRSDCGSRGNRHQVMDNRGI